MNSSTHNKLMLATALMIGAQVIYAFVNFSYDVISNPWNPLLPNGKLSTSAAVFWQYLVAAIFTVPLVLRIGLGHLRTQHIGLHILRALTSAIGVQVFVFGFASGVPIWQMVGLLLTGPFWVILGSVLFLGEKLTTARLAATSLAFIGAFLIIFATSGSVEGGFTTASLLPILAAMLWSATTIITKYLSSEESAESLTLWLLVLIVLCHLVIGVALNSLASSMPDLVPAALASGVDIAMPKGQTLFWVLGLGLITAISNYFLWSAYQHADASYLQPFDDLKLPINVLIGWVLLSQVPGNLFWPGALLIIAASMFIFHSERKKPTEAQMA